MIATQMIPVDLGIEKFLSGLHRHTTYMHIEYALLYITLRYM